MHVVGKKDRQNPVAGRRAVFEKRHAPLIRVEVSVDIVERGQVQREPSTQLRAIPEFIGQNSLRWEPRVAKLGYKARRAVRSYEGSLIDPGIGLFARGGFYRPGSCCPDRMMRMRSPKQADVGLDFEPGVIVMLQLRAQRQPKPVRDEVDLILYECVVEVVAAAARIKGEGKAAGGSIGGKAVPDSPPAIVPAGGGAGVFEVADDRMADSAQEDWLWGGPVQVLLQGCG